MASWFKAALTATTRFIKASLLWVTVAAVSGFLLGYWTASSSSQWMLVNSSSTGGTQTHGIFQTKRRCLRFLDNLKEGIKPHLSHEQAKMMSEEEKKSLSSLEREGIIIHEIRGDLSWVTVSCVRLNDGFLGHLLSDIESTVDYLRSRIDDIESR